MLHNTGMKIGMAVVLFFVFAGWVVALGGTAHATNECREESDAWTDAGGQVQGENPNLAGHLQPFPTPNNDEDH
ncbi:hypothetical protein DUNSADRAFT_13386 [Dunaliella salina]|uniref:Secreted protein n=1 Tax=Dunaliella salina TaxID=3046 RepID=A0ABQ7G9K2_DUNSA|nr:hypothetical protein DUNSADRAFT_13386 [Dunaliella salina]|eukprot:KAF5831235.1 hypothetical protein DUNSADRAFT_13386 [Dunaliella salina]